MGSGSEKQVGQSVRGVVTQSRSGWSQSVERVKVQGH